MKDSDDGQELGELSHHQDSHHEDINMEQDALLGATETTFEDLKSFVAQYGLEDKLDVLQEAAARIEEGDTTPLEVGQRSKWSQPLQLYLCILATALGAMGQGWAQTGINGANLYFPKVFDIDPLTVGFINCGIYFSNGLLGSWLVAPFNHHLGRRWTVFIGGLISVVFNIGSSTANNWWSLLLCRLILGVGLGLVNSTLNIFAAESAPASIRGGLGVAWQMFTAFGIFVSFLTNMLVDSNPERFVEVGWRIMLWAPALPTFPLLLMIFVCPESPAWLVKQTGHYGRAFRSLVRLRNTEIQAAQELLAIHAQQMRLAKTREKRSYVRTLVELFTVPRVRRATLAAYSTQLAQQLCGINIVSINVWCSGTYSLTERRGMGTMCQEQLRLCTCEQLHTTHDNSWRHDYRPVYLNVMVTTNSVLGRFLLINHLCRSTLHHLRCRNGIHHLWSDKLHRSDTRNLEHGLSWTALITAHHPPANGSINGHRRNQLLHLRHQRKPQIRSHHQHDLPLLPSLLSWDGPRAGRVLCRSLPTVSSRARNFFCHRSHESVRDSAVAHISVVAQCIGYTRQFLTLCGTQYCGVDSGLPFCARDKEEEFGGIG